MGQTANGREGVELSAGHRAVGAHCNSLRIQSDAWKPLSAARIGHAVRFRVLSEAGCQIAAAGGRVCTLNGANRSFELRAAVAVPTPAAVGMQFNIVAAPKSDAGTAFSISLRACGWCRA